MRYEARWSNGYWKTFDKQTFEDLAVTYHVSARALVELVAEVEKQCAARIANAMLKLAQVD